MSLVEFRAPRQEDVRAVGPARRSRNALAGVVLVGITPDRSA